eukprot:jgi/Undpi1/10073/HiC_scaffold_28.g12527.m1
MVSSSLLRLATLGVVVLAITGPVVSANSPLNELDGADLIDLLDAELDEDFLTQGFRNLQQFETTGSPTPSPTAGSRELETASPTAATREIETASPTVAMGMTSSPTTMVMETPAPTPADDVETVPGPVSGGVASWRPASAAALGLAAVVATATAVMA